MKANYPLSYAQRSLWFLYRMNPTSPAYNSTIALRIRSEIDADIIQRCARILFERHFALRMIFNLQSGEPVQTMGGTDEPEFIQLNASDCTEESLRQVILEDYRRPFQLENGPLFRVSLFSKAKDDSVLVLTSHQIVCDGWSLSILLEEFGVLYPALRDGTEPLLPELTKPHYEYATREQELLESPPGEKLQAYWQTELKDLPPLLDLPLDHPRPAKQTLQGSTLPFHFEREFSRKLIEFARAQKVSLNALFMSAYQTLLYRYTGQTDLAVGTIIPTRPPEFERTLANLTNTAVIRGQAPGDAPFGEILSHTKSKILRAFRYRQFPFARLVQLLQPDRDETPLFQALFVQQQLKHIPELSSYLLEAREDTPLKQLGGLKIQPYYIPWQEGQFDLSLHMALSAEDELIFWLQYRSDLFERESIERMAGHFRELIKNISQNLARPVSELSILTPEENAVILKRNSTEKQGKKTYPDEGPTPVLFEKVAALFPEALALRFENEILTYQKLNEKTNRLAHYLRNKGACAETILGVCLKRSPELVLTWLAVLKSGAAYLPLDPENPPERLQYMLRESSALLILTDESTADLFEDSPGKLILERVRSEIAEESAENPEVKIKDEDLAYVIFTSGSTGRPRGVGVEHKALLNLIRWHREEFRVTNVERASLVAGVGFDASVWELWPYLTAGASLFMAADETRRSPEKLRDWLLKQEITIIFVPTPMAEHLLELNWPADPPLRLMLTGGDRLRSRPDERIPFALVNNYGPTENTVVTTSGPVEKIGPGSSTSAAPDLGEPIANTEVFVLDRDLRPVPDGLPGEMFIGGKNLARGYINDPDVTARRFPLINGVRMYRTGDRVRRLPEGKIEFLGRLDFQIKIRGFRIEPGEIENALLELEGIGEALVLVRGNKTDTTELIAYLVCREAAPVISEREIRRQLKHKIPHYMLPRTCIFLEKMPLTPNGKPDRHRLPAPPEDLRSQNSKHLSPIEETLCGIVAALLEKEAVAIDDDFFSLGGHSLLATRLLSRIRDSFQVELSLRTLFDEPRLSDLARRIEAERNGDEAPPSPIQPVERNGSAPLSHAQKRLWFLSNLESSGSAYNSPVNLRLKGNLNVNALADSLAEIVRRHETLRTIFNNRAGEGEQIIQAPFRPTIPEVDLRALNPAVQAEEIRRLIRAENGRLFDLSRGPLFRARLLRLNEEENIFLLTFHHILFDGWSLDVLLKELTELYAAFRENRKSPFPDLTIQYADFSHWQNERLQNSRLDKDLDYWRKRLENLPDLVLPLDRPRPEKPNFTGAKESIELNLELGDSLKILSRRQGCTLFMTLLCAFKILLFRISGSQTDLVVGTNSANRITGETEGLIGFFVNMLVLRSDLGGNPTFTDLLSQIRETTLQAFAHQEIPFEKLVTLQRNRNPGLTPLFQTVFSLQNRERDILKTAGLEISMLEDETGATPYDLIISMLDRKRGLTAEIRYNTNLFDVSTIQELLKHYETLLKQICLDPEKRILDFSLSQQSKHPVEAKPSKTEAAEEFNF